MTGAYDRTPMLEQYMAIKAKYPNAILFYRMGDFYEMFYDDAKAASEILGLRLTSRSHGKAAQVPLAGFPHHQLDSYVTRMVNAGRRVVIVEQVEDPKLAKGLVKRDVAKIVTAGTNTAAIDSEQETGNSRIAAIIQDSNRWGLAWADVGSGEFQAGEFTDDEMRPLMSQISPVEIVIPDSGTNVASYQTGRTSPPLISKLDSWVWEPVFARRTLLDHFATIGLKGFGIEQLNLAVSAAGALLHYLKGNLRVKPAHITQLSRADVSGKLQMDAATRQNLELASSMSGNPRATLFSVIDRTVTGLGRQVLYSRMMEPISDRALIEERLSAVEELTLNPECRTGLAQLLKRTGNLHKFMARLATGRGSARDMAAIGDALEILPEYHSTLAGIKSRLLQSLLGRLNPLPELKNTLRRALVDDPPPATTEGGMIRDGFDAEIDSLRQIQQGGKSWLANFELAERKRAQIPNLKVGYNRVFGYFIEVTKSHQGRVPSEYIRRQTLVNAERFTTADLQGYEEKLLSADEKAAERERKIFEELRTQTLSKSAELQENARAIAEFDAILSLAVVAVDENYCRPLLDGSNRLHLVASRHPVVERLMPPAEQFVANDLEFGGDGAKILIITGPNMAGKSTYIRQVALTVVLAQMGSFVPATEAQIGIVDKLFTRIGALDNLAGGESTFLVEMQETASILNNATSKSLVLFDEVGRGTSTFDGLSLAWSIVEYLHDDAGLLPRTLFATHFHELTELEKYLEHVENYNVAVREYGDKVVFLRKIVKGGSDRSFGIHVAQMAGLPPAVIDRAREVLANLESNELELRKPVSDEVVESKVQSGINQGRQMPQARVAQLSLFDPLERQLRELLKNCEPDEMTPDQALETIRGIKKLL